MNHYAYLRSHAAGEHCGPAPAWGATPITAEERDFWRRAVSEQRSRLAAGLEPDDCLLREFD